MILTLFSLLLTAPTSANESYQLTDLEILSKQGPYDEFFRHIYDIRPAQRDEKWLELAKTTSEKYVQHLYDRGKIDTESWRELQNIAGQYYNKNNESLTYPMSRYGLALVKKCFVSKVFDTCYALAQEVLGPKTDFQLSHDLGKVLQDKMENSPTTKAKQIEKIWPFYALMAKNTISEFYCNKPYFQDLALGKIYNELDRKKNKDIKDTVFSLVHQDCWNKIVISLKEQLIKTNSNPELFNLLLATDSIAQEEMLTYSIVYLIQSPKEGPVLDKSWKNLMLIKEDFSKRKKVLDQLKSMDPLPGKIFSNTQDKKSLVIVKNLSSFFPEYVDHYVQTCFKYYSSESPFPNGNPTMECTGLFNMAKKIDILPAMVQKKYEKIRNFQF